MKVTGLTVLLGAMLMVQFGSADAEELVAYVIDESKKSIPQSLTGQPGDASNGKKVAVNRKKGNCLACHEMPIPEEPFHGRIAPSLVGVANRYSEFLR